MKQMNTLPPMHPTPQAICVHCVHCGSFSHECERLNTSPASGRTTRPRRSRARCPSGRTRRSRCRSAFTPSSFRGRAFTAPRAENLRSWLYRLRPSAMHGPSRASTKGWCAPRPAARSSASPNRLRWSPPPMPAAHVDFVDGLATYATCGDARAQQRRWRAPYCANRSMDGGCSTMPTASCSSCRRKARSRLPPSWDASTSRPARSRLIPRGVQLPRRAREARPRAATSARTTARRFACPSSGPSAPTASPTRATSRYPVAAFEDCATPTELVAKFGGHLWTRPSTIRRSTWSPGTATTRPSSTTSRASTR